MIVFKIHVKILSMYLKYCFKYMYFKILPITGIGEKPMYASCRHCNVFFSILWRLFCILWHLFCRKNVDFAEGQGVMNG